MKIEQQEGNEKKEDEKEDRAKETREKVRMSVAKIKGRQ